MTDLMSQGVNLALLGLGTVFVFLTMLVGATVLMSMLVTKLAREPLPPAIKDGQDRAVLAAAVAAVDAHRKRNDGRS